ncbi:MULTISPECIES: hypothetical protein [Pseudomonas]|uniref:hypothetical protein n=1 Tax=Pseudomonas TaxID=286 RepID=UPI00056EB2EA|nr:MULTISPECIES: hypothetical protein [Pseudomonas]MCK2122733.1 hypothetical protein [Pseudomonas sp. PNPG3]
MIVNNVSNTASSAYANASLRKTAFDAGVNGSIPRAYETHQPDESNQVDGVSLSSTSAHYSHSIANYAVYFPARPGMAADALVLGVSQPGAVSSSKGKLFPEVASDVRSRLDDKYALMKSSGKPYDGSDTDRNSLLGDLDRRSLYAVATNQGGQFSAEEQAAAKGLMRQQERLATGYYSGPEDQQKNFTDPYANDPVGRAKAALAFLENMSPEEKAAPEWLVQHQTLSDALEQTGSDNPTAKKDKGHFHNLSEILAGIDTDGSEEKQTALGSGEGSNSYVFEQVQTALRAQQSAADAE